MSEDDRETMKRELVFGIYQTPDGPKVERRMDKALVLRMLAAYMEDLRLDLVLETLTEARKADNIVKP